MYKRASGGEREIAHINKAFAIKISGIVQGVGYRPFIFLMAKRYELTGFVVNKGGEVFVNVEGKLEDLHAFLSYITENYPEGAIVEAIITKEERTHGFNSFEICESSEDIETVSGIPPDISMCEDCHKDILNMNSRYYLYPFTSCTKCGPRLTIINKLPYDRKNTAMNNFNICSECEREYRDPLNRRYHAQTICCSKCGPVVRLLDKFKAEINGEPFKKAKEMLKQGMILAAKGIGGYHIICNAFSSNVIAKLRKNKNRNYKPFAVMFRDIEAVKKHCKLNEYELELLMSRQKPIVLLRQKEESNLSRMVNPDVNKLGALLPYSGIHHLLFDEQNDALVVTSGNVSGLPLIIEDEAAFEQLKEIADAFLVHNREILNPCDDSVSQIVSQTTQLIRRARGYTPLPVIFKNTNQSILACGSDLKNTFCILKGDRAYVSQHMGDLQRYETQQEYKTAIERYKAILNYEPELIACDMHPDYATKRLASEFGLPVTQIQHHHAHIASVLAENNLDQHVIGVALDGAGYGADGTIWGGEFLVTSLSDYKRVGHFKNMPMPGGDMAAKEPWRMAGAYLYNAFGENLLNLDIECSNELAKKDWRTLWKSVSAGLNKTETSSAGRLFDAVSAILGIRYCNDYEGQAAAELESIAEYYVRGAYGYEIYEKSGLIIDFRETILAIVQDITNNISRGEIAGKFHNMVSQVILDTCERIKKSEGLNIVALGGGVFQNSFLLKRTIEKLNKSGFSVIINSLIPCNDGGISLGQAAIASKT